MNFAKYLKLSALCLTMAVPGRAHGYETKISPGYANYREMFIAIMDRIEYPLPDELAHKINVCATDVWFEHATPAELVPLDRYARGEIELEEAEFKRLNVQVDKRMGGAERAWPLIVKKCPHVVAEAELYKKKS